MNKIKKENTKDQKQFYDKYRWFFTKSGVLVYGGKSAEQNEEIVGKLIKEKKDYVVMHTKMPGSPFAVIMEDPKKIDEEDLEEAAIWTACFSRAWRNEIKETWVDVFLSKQLYKSKGMSVGTFGIKGPIDRRRVNLKLVLSLQKNSVRAVPEISLKPKEKIYYFLVPGKVEKSELAEHLSIKLKRSKEEVLNALPKRRASVIG